MLRGPSGQRRPSSTSSITCSSAPARSSTRCGSRPVWRRDRGAYALTSIDSLDDCGSFGSAFLEVAKDHRIDGYREIADYVADYISNKQDRQPDGRSSV